MKPQWLPSWLDPAAYPTIDDPLRVWAWQFLRRNPAYCSKWQDLKDRGIVGADGSLGHGAAQGFRETFGVAFPLDPAKQNHQPFFLATAICEWRGPGRPPPGTESVLFDLASPLEAQLRRAEPLLRASQDAYLKAKEIALPAPRNHKEKWRDYLRVLDAKAAEIQDAAIAEVIFPGKINKYPEYAGTKQVNNYYNAACSLRDGRYKEMLLMPE